MKRFANNAGKYTIRKNLAPQTLIASRARAMGCRPGVIVWRRILAMQNKKMTGIAKFGFIRVLKNHEGCKCAVLTDQHG